MWLPLADHAITKDAVMEARAAAMWLSGMDHPAAPALAVGDMATWLSGLDRPAESAARAKVAAWLPGADKAAAAAVGEEWRLRGSAWLPGLDSDGAAPVAAVRSGA